MYRAMTWWMLRDDVDVTTRPRRRRGREPVIMSGTDPLAPDDHRRRRRRLRRDPQRRVTAAVSPVSTVPEVRARLLALQRAIIDAAPGGIVVEGRDIGSVVGPTPT